MGAVVCPTDVKELKIAGYYERDGSNGRSGRRSAQQKISWQGVIRKR
jgi:hypothetical protein